MLYYTKEYFDFDGVYCNEQCDHKGNNFCSYWQKNLKYNSGRYKRADECLDLEKSGEIYMEDNENV